MKTVRLNEFAVLAIQYMLSHRAKMYATTTNEAEKREAREQVRSYAVEVVNELLREHPELMA